jgi:hypothetical protein
MTKMEETRLNNLSKKQAVETLQPIELKHLPEIGGKKSGRRKTRFEAQTAVKKGHPGKLVAASEPSVATMNRVLGELCRCLQVELLFNVRLVGFDRFNAEVQPFGDLSRWEAVTHHLKHLKFAVT